MKTGCLTCLKKHCTAYTQIIGKLVYNDERKTKIHMKDIMGNICIKELQETCFNKQN